MCIENDIRMNVLEGTTAAAINDLNRRLMELEGKSPKKPKKTKKKKAKYVPFMVAYAAYKKGKKIIRPRHILPYSLEDDIPDILNIDLDDRHYNDWIILD